MNTYAAKVVVRLKPNISDIKGQTLKRAIESYIDVKNLSCRIGSFYYFEFNAVDQVEALNMVEKIAKDLLTNEIAEMYIIKSLEEI